MSAQHLQRIEFMIKHAQEFLYTVQRNIAPDMDLFDENQAKYFELLKVLGPVPLNSPYLVQIRSRMMYLESLNTEMVKVIKKLLNDSRNQLKTTSTRKRGMSGNQRSLFGRSRGKGIWRGQG